MKLIKEDITRLRTALLAAKLAGLESVVFSEGKVRGINPAHNGVIFSTCTLEIDPEITIGISRLSELEKRMSLFGDDITIEAEVTEAKKCRKLLIKAKTSKMDFRCTDEKLIKYPKTVGQDDEAVCIKITKSEVSLISKAIKTLGPEQITVQIKKDGIVHIEAIDSNNDRFETDLSNTAEFISDPIGIVNNYQTGSNGVFLSMLEYSIKDLEEMDLVMTASGNISLSCFGHSLIAIPKIDS